MEVKPTVFRGPQRDVERWIAFMKDVIKASQPCVEDAHVVWLVIIYLEAEARDFILNRAKSEIREQKNFQNLS